MFRNVSKFRNVTNKPSKETYGDIKVSSPSPTSVYAAASTQFIAVPHGMGSYGNVAILPIKHSEFVRRPDPLVISAHAETLTDLAFNPFNSNVLATCSKEEVVKLFTIPAGGLTANVSEPTVQIGGFEGGINSISFHRSASNLLGAATKFGFCVADVEKGSIAYTFKSQGAGKDMLSADWSYDGNLLAGVSKDQFLHVFDPRVAAQDVLASSVKLEMKPQRAMFLGRDHSLVLLGANKMRSPQIAIYDSRNTAKALLDTQLQCSMGALLATYDVDTQLMFLAVRGSAMMSIYDLSETGKLQPCSNIAGQTLFQATTLIPKGACDLQACEVQRVIKVTPDSVEQISILLPRKIAGFHEDVYPDTLSSEPGLTGAEWLGGKDSAPKLVNILKVATLNPLGGAAAASAPAAPAARTSTSSVADAKQNSDVDRRSSSNSDSRASPPPASEQKLASALEVKSETRKALEEQLKRSSLFANVQVSEPQASGTYYFDVQMDPNMALSRNIKVNDQYWACAWKTLGGSGIYVNPIKNFGRIANGGVPPLVRGHSAQVTVFDLSVLNSNLLASGSSDCKVKVHQLPGDVMASDLKESVDEFSLNGRVATCDFHPAAANVLAASSSGFDGTFLKLYDLNAHKEAFTVDCHKDGLYDVAFAVDCSVMATTCKDKRTRVIDPRNGIVAFSFEPFEGARDTRVFWAGKGNELSKRLITVGFGKMSKRSISFYDLRDLSQPIKQLEIDTTNSSIIPHYDEDTRLLHIASSGTRLIRLFQISDETGVEYLSTFTSGGDVTGMAFRPKNACDIKNAEIASGFTLNKGDHVMPLSYRVPRKRLEYFQDDIFPPTRVVEPLVSAEEFYSMAEQKQPSYVSLKPADMTPLSEAPPEQLSERQIKYAQGVVAKEAPKAKGILGHQTADEVREHFLARAAIRPAGNNRWDARRDETYQEVADDEWN